MDLLLLRAVQVEEVLLDHGGFASVAGMVLDRGDQVRGAAIVEKKDALSQSPQRSCTKLIPTRIALGNIVSQPRSHVMNLDIGVGIHRRAGQR